MTDKERHFERAAHASTLHTCHKFYGARMYRSGAVNHTNSGNFQAVNWDAESYDTSPNSNLVNLTNNSFDIQLAGYYSIRAVPRFEGNATGRRLAHIVSAKLGTLSEAEYSASDAANVNPGPLVVWRGYLSLGDVITFEAYQNTGGNLGYTVGSQHTWADIELVGV